MRLLLADDHRIMREGLRALLENQPEMTVVAEAENGRRAVELAQKLHPDVVIMDVSMTELNGIEATRQIRASLPNAKVIALSIHSDRRFVVQMFKAGASGYLRKDCACEELTHAVRVVCSGQAYISPGITDVVLNEVLRSATEGNKRGTPSLTSREREVLQLMAEGRSTKEIASLLKVSIKTIETHRHMIMEKLHLNSVAELTKYAIREGLTQL